uniref:DAZ interacting zinc finger protein 1 n=1 Tax=Leptobrachium leishanense TaxID=445787 RepID=A0A8C5P951_9ANUR
MPFSNHESLFKFRSRHESVDWRRIGAIDVDKVANELDFITLQDLLMNVTFCSVENEKCPHCNHCLDPLFLKLLRLAQFIIEYLLHSQEYLTASLQTVEKKVQATHSEMEEVKLKTIKQAQEIKTLKEECRHRKKMIATQQLLISSGANSYNKCNYCNKAFLNYSYLQSHIQRRHTDEASDDKFKFHQLRDKLQHEITQLKEELHMAKSQLEAEKSANLEKLSKALENEQKEAIEEEICKKFDSWKAEEKEKIADELEKVREMFMKELKELSMKNSTLEKELNELKESRLIISGLGDLHGSLRNNEEMSTCLHELETVKELLQTQEDKWGNKIRLIRQEHNKEKNQLLSEMEKLRLSMSDEQRARSDFNQKRLEELEKRLQEQNELIRTQKQQQMNEIPTKPLLAIGKHAVPESPVLSQNIPPKSVISRTREQAHILESIMELSDEDRDLDVEKPRFTNHMKTANSLKKIQPYSRELKTILEQTLTEKLESLGVKPEVRGITREHLQGILSQLESSREQDMKKVPEIDYIRESLVRHVNTMVKERTSSTYSKTAQVLSDSKTSTSGSTSSILLTKYSRNKSKHFQQDCKPEAEDVTSELRYSIPLKSSTPKVMLVSSKDVHMTKQSSIGTPPFSSDEESDVSKAPRNSLKPKAPFKTKTNLSFDWKTTQDIASNDSDSEGSILEATEQQRVYRNNVHVQAPTKPMRATLVKGHAATYSKGDKPDDGIHVTQPTVIKDSVMELKAGDLEDSDFDSTSEEEPFEVPRPVKDRPETRANKKGLPPVPVKTAFGPAKPPKGVVREGDSSSTLFSTLVTVSDFSDCSDV